MHSFTNKPIPGRAISTTPHIQSHKANNNPPQERHDHNMQHATLESGKLTMRLFRLTLICTFAFCAIACHNTEDTATDFIPAPPDYTRTTAWFSTDTTGTTAHYADVFYIAPTCIWDWTAPTGAVCHYMNIDDSAQRTAVDNALRLGLALFGKDCRFFAPYYRQITMESWMTDGTETDRRYETAHTDIVVAFQYYMTHYNQGRPFILAGHSQGAKAVIELLKRNLTETQRQRLVAAYAFGFTITADELRAHTALAPAQDSTDLGTIICFNSVSDPGAISPLFADNTVCINPLNWTTDTTYAPSSQNLGSVFLRADGSVDTILYSVGARLNLSTHTLIVDGIDPAQYYIPSISSLFPMGNFHVQEINLYFNNLQHNIRQRIETYIHSH